MLQKTKPVAFSKASHKVSWESLWKSTNSNFFSSDLHCSYGKIVRRYLDP